MNYYKFHIGDYTTQAAHLSMTEDGAYRRLLDLYYTRELPFPSDLRRVQRLVRAFSQEEKTAVETVLREFFTETDDGWVQRRCDAEILAYNDIASKNRKIGVTGGRPKKTQTVSENNPNGFQNETQTVSENNPNGFQNETQTVSENNPNGFQNETQTVSSDTVFPETQTEPSHYPLPITHKEEKRRGESDLQSPAPEKPQKGSRLAKVWVIPVEYSAWAKTERPSWSPQKILATADKFRDYWTAKTGATATKIDWFATWRNWVRNEGDDRPAAVMTTAEINRSGMRQILEAVHGSERPWENAIDGSVDTST